MSLIHVFPGQGAQHVGMGEAVFPRFRSLVKEADRQLGYSIEELCLRDPAKQLGLTQFTQPALFVVNALCYHAKLEETGRRPDFVAGHSLGEYNALLAAGAIDFSTGLQLVNRRGELMARVEGGGMAAIMGMKPDRIAEILFNFAFDEVDVANYNAPMQTVISGPEADVKQASAVFKEAGAMVTPLNVSGAFHSRMMKSAELEFARQLEGAAFGPLEIPVIANVSGRPYEAGAIRETLARQLSSPVRWTDSIRFLLGQPEPVFESIGPGKVLTRLIDQIRSEDETSERTLKTAV